jgi:hypothetical protein
VAILLPHIRVALALEIKIHDFKKTGDQSTKKIEPFAQRDILIEIVKENSQS